MNRGMPTFVDLVVLMFLKWDSLVMSHFCKKLVRAPLKGSGNQLFRLRFYVARQ